jgi:hypothetical protein
MSMMQCDDEDPGFEFMYILFYSAAQVSLVHRPSAKVDVSISWMELVGLGRHGMERGIW